MASIAPSTSLNKDTPSVGKQEPDAELYGEPGSWHPRTGDRDTVGDVFHENISPSERRIMDITDIYNKETYEIAREMAPMGAWSGDVNRNEDPEYSKYVASVIQRYRTPWVISCKRWMSEGQYIVFRANPTNVSWRITLRGQEQVVRAGRVQHLWRHKLRHTYFNEPEVDIQFQSGNIMPVRIKPFITKGSSQASDFPFGDANVTFNIPGLEQFSTNNYSVEKPPRKIKDLSETVKIPTGLWNFYQFLALMDEQRILDDGTTNLVYIFYHSNVFPSLILSGLFSPQNGVSFTEDSEDPFQIKWNATFTVYSSTPQLGVNGLIELRQQFVRHKFRDDN